MVNGDFPLTLYTSHAKTLIVSSAESFITHVGRSLCANRDLIITALRYDQEDDLQALDKSHTSIVYGHDCLTLLGISGSRLYLYSTASSRWEWANIIMGQVSSTIFRGDYGGGQPDIGKLFAIHFASNESFFRICSGISRAVLLLSPPGSVRISTQTPIRWVQAANKNVWEVSTWEVSFVLV